MNGYSLNLAPSLDKGEGVRALLDKVSATKDVLSKVILHIGNGLLLIHARGDIGQDAAITD